MNDWNYLVVFEFGGLEEAVRLEEPEQLEYGESLPYEPGPLQHELHYDFEVAVAFEARSELAVHQNVEVFELMVVLVHCSAYAFPGLDSPGSSQSLAYSDIEFLELAAAFLLQPGLSSELAAVPFVDS